ncbi:MAG: toll/interleukin-1 receptor domain-containing protein, partial [Methylococcaceae bacterium]
MSKIFISHASQDNQAALSLRDWLLSNGFDEVFLDLDPETGIKAGDRWQETLLAACRDCEAVIFLISKNWLESNWCLTEYLFTKNFGKRCLPVLIEDVTPETIPDYLTAEHQIVNLVTDPTAYNRLKKGLEQAGIAAESFSLP